MKPRIYITTYSNTGRFIIEKILNDNLDTIYISIDHFIKNKFESLSFDTIEYIGVPIKLLKFKNTKLFYEI
jgi:hypothetical protein